MILSGDKRTVDEIVFRAGGSFVQLDARNDGSSLVLFAVPLSEKVFQYTWTPDDEDRDEKLRSFVVDKVKSTKAGK